MVDTGTNNVGKINRARFEWTDSPPTGTGHIDSFLRVQASPTEQGYNTSSGTPFDDKAGPFTHDITVANLEPSIVKCGRLYYYKFLLDVNDPGGDKSLISLDSLDFYTSATGSQTTEAFPRSACSAGAWMAQAIVMCSSKVLGTTTAAPATCMSKSPSPISREALPTDYVALYVPLRR